MKWNSRTRCAIVCLGFVLLFSAFSFRLIYLQMIKHDQYAGLAAEKHVYKQPIFAERKQSAIRSDKNCAPKIYAASISNRTQPAFIPTG
ncbi:MAG: hypothetical protein DMF18_06575 [Verrucomicrobia bacterium]|nr:MAG: hypothetical protein DMF18_06575 [Verrucomicrobiota bacterium]